MDINGASAAVTLTLGLIALVGAVVGWVKWYKPIHDKKERERIAQLHALVGRPAVNDSITGKEISPALPGIGQRMASVEVAISELAKSNLRHESHEAHLAALEKLAAVHEAHLSKNEERLSKHDDAIEELQNARVERIVTRAESAAAWRAVEAVAKPDYIDTDDDEPDL